MFIDWNKFVPETAAAELPRLFELAEGALERVEGMSAPTYGEYFHTLNDAFDPLFETWGAIGHMNQVMNSESWRKLEEEWQPKFVAFSMRIGQSPRLYAHLKRLCGDPALDPVQRRIVEHSELGMRLSGVALDGEAKRRFCDIQQELAKLATDFHNAIIDSVKAYRYEKDGKTYTIDDANYPQTMKHCADREVREALFRAHAVRALDNIPRIDRILELRRQKADLLGFSDYVELSLATKCAPSADAVRRMIDELDAATEEIANGEEAELDAFAAKLADGPLAQWDRPFYCERLREEKYRYSEDELKRHFELEVALKGLFRVTEALFGVQVIEIAGAEKPPVWHPDVRFFEFREKGETVARFYFDPYVRNGQKAGGAWMNEFRNRSKRLGQLPLAVIVTNFPEPDADGHCHLPMREVETLFHEFGHCLQCCLTRVDEEDAAGINLVEWDAVEVASQFMENWCLDDLAGIELPEDLKAKVRAAKNFRAASVCRRQLAFAKLDLELHSGQRTESDPNRLKETMFRHFGLRFVPEDRMLASFAHIFAGGYAAGYYGYKWAEVMSCDAYGAFEEVPRSDYRTVGSRYRETVLALGGSKSAYEVFRLFRGREPSIGPMLRQQGLKG